MLPLIHVSVAQITHGQHVACDRSSENITRRRIPELKRRVVLLIRPGITESLLRAAISGENPQSVVVGVGAIGVNREGLLKNLPLLETVIVNDGRYLRAIERSQIVTALRVITTDSVNDVTARR